MENGLLTELLEAITAVHTFLSKDLAKDKLSSKNQKNRHSFIQRLDDVLNKLHKANDAAKQDPLIKEPPRPPPITSAPPSSHSKPYPSPMGNTPDEEGEVYDVPEQEPTPPTAQAEYSSFVPVSLDNEEPQEEYLAMEANQKEAIDDEMYEDPSQTVTQQSPPIISTPAQLPPSLPPSVRKPSSPTIPDPEDQEPGLYEDPLIQNPSTHNSSPSPSSGAGYMDPIMLTDQEKRMSRVPEELIDDWDLVYESNNFGKKKEKVKASKLKNVVMKGSLEKLGGRSHKNWQKRYCVLAEVFMYFYEKESSGTYNNRIPIPGFVPNPSSELTAPKKAHYAFKLSSTDSSGKNKDYYFRAKTEVERDNWVAAIRKIFEQGRVEIEKRKSVTLPNQLSQASVPGKLPPPPDIPEEQEEYEALGPGTIEEEPQEEYEALGPGTIEVDDQEEYVVVPDAINNAGELEDSQEEYMDVNPQPMGGGGTSTTEAADDEQEDYVEPTEALTSYKSSTSVSSIPPPVTKQPLPPPPATPTSPNSISQQPLPPKPSSISKQPLPAPPSSISQQPLPAPPPVQQPDPEVDTAKVYIQAPNGIKYSNVYVMAWDFQGMGEDELKMKRGDLVLVEEPKQEEQWWFGEQLAQDCSRKLGQSGLFPANYCSIAFKVV